MTTHLTPESPHRTAALSAREALERLELLATVSRILAGAMEDYREPIGRFAEACVPDFADLCVVEMMGGCGEPETVALRVAPTSGITAPAEWTPVGPAVATSQRGVLVHLDPTPLGPAQQLIAALGAQSVIAAPIAAGGLTLGWLVLGAGWGRRGFRPSALGVAEELARRLATTVQRVLLYRETVTSAQGHERAARRLRRLASTAAALAGADTAEAVLQIACVQTCINLDAEGAAASWELPGGRRVTAAAGRVTDVRADAEARSLVAGHTTRGPGWVAVAMGEEQSHASLVVFGSRPLQPDDETVLQSIASLVPVAFERALGTETAVLHEARLEAVLEASPVAIVGVDRALRVRSANPAARALFDWGEDPQTWVVPDVVRPEIESVLGAVIAGHRVLGRTVTAGRFDLSVSAAPMPAAGGAGDAVVLTAFDLREQRVAERALLQAQRLEAMGQVAGGVAHEFNNLLTVIIGYSDLLRQAMAGDPAASFVDGIQKAADRAGGLTRQLLKFTRRQAGDGAAVADLSHALLLLAPVLASLAGPRVELQLPEVTYGLSVMTDPAEVEQILLNLAINACDAMDGTGRLVVEIEEVPGLPAGHRVIATDGGPFLRLSVVDTGPGMTEDVRNRCLEPFFTTKPPGEGSGLGLSTVSGIAAQRGGTVAVSSAPGEGTRVDVWLPVAPAGCSRAATPPTCDPARPLHARVLLVEDDDDVRALAVDALQRIGIESIAVPDGLAALLHVNGDLPVDLLITDIVLPGMTGVELAQRARRQRPGLPVLYVSGYADPEIRQGLETDAVLLRKPYSHDELRARVAELLARQSTAATG